MPGDETLFLRFHAFGVTAGAFFGKFRGFRLRETHFLSFSLGGGWHTRTYQTLLDVCGGGWGWGCNNVPWHVHTLDVCGVLSNTGGTQVMDRWCLALKHFIPSSLNRKTKRGTMLLYMRQWNLNFTSGHGKAMHFEKKTDVLFQLRNTLQCLQ